MNKIMISYSGKSVYIGIDVHKKSYVLTAICDSEIVKRWTTKADPKNLAASLKKWFPDAKIFTAYEAGFSGFVLHRALIEQGVQNIVVNPASIEVASNDRVKTDKRDSKKIAEQLAAKRLKGIYIPSIEEELSRLFARTRAQLVKLRAQVAVRIKSRLHQFGLYPHSNDTKFSKSFIAAIEKIEMPTELQICIETLVAEWRSISDRIKAIEEKMTRQAKDNESVEATYRSVPGIGPISARILASELGDMSRFKNERSLFSYSGLTPGEHSSGTSVRKGHISRQGAARLRALLVEAAWRAVSGDDHLAIRFNEIKARRGAKIAIVAIARKLLGRIKSCFQSNTLYQLNYQEK